MQQIRERLAAAIILQAIRDWEKGKDRAKIEEFFHSDDFDCFLKWLSLDPIAIRNKLDSQSYDRQIAQNFRAAYR